MESAPTASRSPRERFPLFVVNHELRPGSAGDGQWRGGLGAVCEIIYEGEGEALLNTAGDGAVVPPFGVLGGKPGLPAHILRRLRRGGDGAANEADGRSGQAG